MPTRGSIADLRSYSPGTATDTTARIRSRICASRARRARSSRSRSCWRFWGEPSSGVHERAAALQGKPRWADKNPDNGLYTPQSQALLGDDWLFVQVDRDPLDTLGSMEMVRLPLTLPPELDARIRLFLDLQEAGLRFGE